MGLFTEPYGSSRITLLTKKIKNREANRMTIKLHRDLIQGSEEWHAARCGLLTASEMRFILTPAKLQYAKGAETHLKELASQRITQYVEPGFVSDDMLRGHEMEGPAKLEYERSEGVMVQDDVAFITNDEWGFTLGYSPDGLVGDDGLIEIKAPRQKGQFGNIIDGVMPDEFRIQVQTGMLVSGRDWCDFISYCAGMPMMVLRVYPCRS